MFVHRCEILDFWHALEHAWGVARLLYGEESQMAGRWVHRIAEDLRAGKVQEVIARLQRMRPKTPELREKLQGLIAYYSQHVGRMRYDEYLAVPSQSLLVYRRACVWATGSAVAPWRARISRWCRPASVRPA
jgi:hypothetical protein